MKLKHIKKGDENGLFDWILESDNHATYSENNSAMIRALVKKHNEMVDVINDLKNANQ